MERLETASDSLSSNFSSMSGLTGFEEEFYGIKSSIHSNRSISFNHENENFDFLKLNGDAKVEQKYKDDLYDLECKIELANHNKFDKLLKHNLQLENELSACNKRILELTSNKTDACKQQEIVEHELKQKVLDIQQYKNEIDDLQLLNNNLKIKYEEAKLDLDTKSTSVVGLKKKIVDLHVDTQMLNVTNTKLTNDLNILNNNLHSLKKSELWYKEQLHLSRSQKSALAQEVAQIRFKLIEKEHEINSQVNECLRLNMLLEKVNSRNAEKLPETNGITANHTIKDLRTELVALSNAIQAQRSSLEGVTKENCELQERNCELLKLLSDKDFIIGNLENDCRDLSHQLENLRLKTTNVEELHLKTVSEKSSIELALAEAKKEKDDVESGINLIRNDFAKFVERYNNTKTELFLANRCNKRLREENDELDQNLADSNAKLSKNLVQQEQLLELQKQFENSLKDEAETRSNLKDLHQKYDEVCGNNEILQKQNLQLKDSEAKCKKLLHSFRYKVKHVEHRCQMLHSRILADEEEITALKTVDDESVCVKNLKALCRAKDLEITEKCEKYECNCRTLLRKVKEHMRGRNAAEKRFLQLQESYNSVSQELNAFKLQAVSKSLQLADLQSESLTLQGRDVRSKEIIVRLEGEVVDKNIDLETQRKAITQLEIDILKCKNMLSKELALNEQLKVSNDDKDFVVKQLELKIQDLCDNNDELERLLKHAYRDLSIEQQRYTESALELEETRSKLQQMQTENEILTEDCKNISKELELKVKELAKTLQQKYLLLSQIKLLQTNLGTLTSDKYFLQRLCNDLKFALTTTRSQSDVLKKHVEVLSSEYSSLPNYLDAPSPSRFEEAYINELLQENLKLSDEQPLDNLHVSLNLLKNEMANLRQQVVGNFS